MNYHFTSGASPIGKTDERRFFVVSGRKPFENRAAHRARLKRERREARRA